MKMDVRIADTFTDSLARLTGELGAVRPTATRPHQAQQSRPERRSAGEGLVRPTAPGLASPLLASRSGAAVIAFSGKHEAERDDRALRYRRSSLNKGECEPAVQLV